MYNIYILITNSTTLKKTLSCSLFLLHQNKNKNHNYFVSTSQNPNEISSPFGWERKKSCIPFVQPHVLLVFHQSLRYFILIINLFKQTSLCLSNNASTCSLNARSIHCGKIHLYGLYFTLMGTKGT
jgi:hypothetical protein